MGFIFALSLLFGVCGTLFGMSINQNNKYVHLIRQEGCVSSWKDIINTNNDLICCPVSPTMDEESICSHNMLGAHFLSSLGGSWILPLLPLLFSWFVSFDPRFGYWQSNPKVRLQVYLTLMCFRTICLYYGLNELERSFQHHHHHTTSDCDYKELLPHGNCDSRWNASDHVMLFWVHHIAIAASELEIHFPLLFAQTHMKPATSISWTPFVLLTCSISMAIIAGATFCIFQTAAFFHTRSETFCAFIFGLSTVIGSKHLQISYYKDN